MKKSLHDLPVSARYFVHPEPKAAPLCLKPVFLPFSGCSRRCFFCAQHLQSGCAPKPLSQVYSELEEWLIEAGRNGHRPVELGFYGGTFTALPQYWLNKFLNLAAWFKKQGLVQKVRASTRPDAALEADLSDLAARGLDLLELGVQSFSSEVLDRLGRGYQGRQAEQACRMVKAAGLGLAMHLMPGSPGMTEEIFEQDIEKAVEQRPDFMRLHPCLVLAGTELEREFLAGRFLPWELSGTARALSSALIRLWENRIRVIRVGLTAEDALLEAIVAGPWHPCLGLMARSLALYRIIKAQAAELPGQRPLRLRYPRRFGGEIWGHRRALVGLYESVNLSPDNAGPWDEEEFSLWRVC